MKEVGFLLTMIRGAIGKELVVKHYRYGVVVTRYPDMSGVGASAGQRACRDVFREAVAFAKGVFADGVRKAYYREKLGKVRGLFQAVVREYMKNVRRETSEVSGKEEGLRTSKHRLMQGNSLPAKSQEKGRLYAAYFTRVQVSVLPMRDMPT